uniref:Uncharacterized protein n=1 Tax=Rhizophora mucronata TaxID=61149 RepID=A0A2P2M9U0_RHIMU
MPLFPGLRVRRVIFFLESTRIMSWPRTPSACGALFFVTKSLPFRWPCTNPPLTIKRRIEVCRELQGNYASFKGFTS